MEVGYRISGIFKCSKLFFVYQNEPGFSKVEMRDMKRYRLSIIKCWRDRKYLEAEIFRKQKLVMIRKIIKIAPTRRHTI